MDEGYLWADPAWHARSGSLSSSRRVAPRPARGEHALCRRGHSADRHTIYKNGVKEIAFLHGISATFMAKPSEKDIGSSCHIHSSLVRDGQNAFVDGEEETDAFRHYLGGMRNHIRELALFVAPSINSYKRYATESRAPTSISWGRDNRTCGFRIVGHGQSRRAPSAASRRRREPLPRLRGAARCGARRDRERDRPGPELKGNAYEEAEAEPFPEPLREAVDSGSRASSPSAPRRAGLEALPQLRAHRAAPVRRGRDRLRAAPHVRARLSLPTVV